MPLDFINTTTKSDKEFSQDIDLCIGFNIDSIEQVLREKAKAKKQYYNLNSSRTWVGLHPQIFQTPYPEIYHFFQKLSSFDISHVVDLGAAYGRVGIVMNNFFPKANFVGFEFINERGNEANRVFSSLGMRNCTLKTQNIVDESFEIPAADLYFVYDFSDRLDQERILKVFSKKLENEQFFLVVRGKSMRSLIQNKYPEFYRIYRPFHTDNWSIYSSWCDLI